MTGVPKSDLERLMAHYGIDAGTASQALAICPASKLLPRAGRKRAGTASPGEVVPIPLWLFSGLVAFGFGVILGPSVFALSTVGSERLAELARRKVVAR